MLIFFEWVVRKIVGCFARPAFGLDEIHRYFILIYKEGKLKCLMDFLNSSQLLLN